MESPTLPDLHSKVLYNFRIGGYTDIKFISSLILICFSIPNPGLDYSNQRNVLLCGLENTREREREKSGTLLFRSSVDIRSVLFSGVVLSLDVWN